MEAEQKEAERKEFKFLQLCVYLRKASSLYACFFGCALVHMLLDMQVSPDTEALLQKYLGIIVGGLVCARSTISYEETKTIFERIYFERLDFMKESVCHGAFVER